MDALQLLREDHHHVKDLFKQFEDAEDGRQKGRIVGEALTALEIHAEIEEEIFYPAVRKEADADTGEMDEAEEEHHVVKLLIGELRKMKPGAPRYDAKFTVLAENVKHHIDEEESEMLPKAAELGMQRLNELGAVMEKRKLQLMSGTARKSKPRTVTNAAKKATRPAPARRTLAGSRAVTGASKKSAPRSRAKAAVRSVAKKAIGAGAKRR